MNKYCDSYYTEQAYYDEYQIEDSTNLEEKIRMLTFNNNKAVAEIKELRTQNMYKVNVYDIRHELYNILDSMTLDELYGIIYKKLFNEASTEKKAEYYVLYNLLNKNNMKTVIAIQTGIATKEFINTEVKNGTR